MSAHDARPNIVVIMTDDQGYWALGCAGNDEISTPALDDLAAEGLRLTNFFCASPVCSPARASVLTGKMPSQHGVHDWIRGGNSSLESEGGGRLIEYMQRHTGFTSILDQRGYNCGLCGKWHLGAAPLPQQGFSFWRVHAMGGGPYYGAPMIHESRLYREPAYITEAITGHALEFLDKHGRAAAPFCLSVHYTAPHSPWDRGNHPAELYDDYLENCDFNSVPNDPRHPWQIKTAPQPDTDEERRNILAGYYSAVTAMDRGVQRILDRLEQYGLRDNTLVVFMSDNGMNMGHHGIYGKGNGTFPQNMYDTSVRVPCIISWPGRWAGGEVCDALLSQVDIYPTMLELTGEPAADDSLPGNSLLPLFDGTIPAGHDSLVVYDEYGPVRMIRTEDHKLVRRYPYGPDELYDLSRDPRELVNLIDDQAYRRLRVELDARLTDWFLRYSDPAVEGVREPVTGCGQVGLCGAYASGEQAFCGRAEGAWNLSNEP